VIFGLLAGGEIYGFPGILVSLPLLAAGRAVWEFFSERIALQKWAADEPLAEIGIAPATAPPPAPGSPPAPAS
jgi:hypothetical protein